MLAVHTICGIIKFGLYYFRGIMSKYRKEYYQKNRAGMDASARKYILRRTQENRSYVDALRESPCTDCGKCYDPVCMDFDHVIGNKHKTISSMIPIASLESIKTEIAKCELVCANCHRIRTKNRGYKGGRKKSDKL